jgi:hypothetical protein
MRWVREARVSPQDSGATLPATVSDRDITSRLAGKARDQSGIVLGVAVDSVIIFVGMVEPFETAEIQTIFPKGERKIG